jgi:hypothetical protein
MKREKENIAELCFPFNIASAFPCGQLAQRAEKR